MTKKKNKRWLGLESHEAFTDPVKDRDPGGKIHDRGVKIVVDRTDIKTGDKRVRAKKE